ncbi:uncharacterized protein TEOVI_000407000 [Trypanosoma equiperdum]|uniref:Uncharacterized protein n=4 Tax=Trypanozoon TaxID=39700 RepID=Q38CF0_TRYB2|nr:hypothetical protein, conserved [Trypanosoma brucei gambiense DAL972]XP_822348.1 hypothetical protein, conserved [Trypanosoma brucei brucei TREU927]RHW69631.1 hypothetical protein DPX39_100014000 [Trypanosoma brucei equiperdum]SCU72493.1 hypothetical protein, conserved [Trypanosoma equiperdum]EAN77520.1 hypothetical protein, conserved [Trypanosoma brucei brucei TREU927]CBH15018.1 hypothetical protein, conserved [Trypanosoma brucei gambiense DAL972]|eukprot:XP_011777284.1 hypothetical protein, conserved [Trypanosoma brucei gambiense DAL972]
MRRGHHRLRVNVSGEYAGRALNLLLVSGRHVATRKLSNFEEVATLRRELAAAQQRIAELQLSQVAVHEALLKRLEESHQAVHKAAIHARHAALALQCSHDLMERELRRVLSITPTSSNMSGVEVDRLRRAAVEAGAREIVRRNIGFRVEKQLEDQLQVEKDSGESNTIKGG